MVIMLMKPIVPPQADLSSVKRLVADSSFQKREIVDFDLIDFYWHWKRCGFLPLVDMVAKYVAKQSLGFRPPAQPRATRPARRRHLVTSFL